MERILKDRNGRAINVGDRVIGQDSNGSHAVNVVPIKGTVKGFDQWGGITIALDQPRIKYFRNEGGKLTRDWYFTCGYDGRAMRKQGDPFEHGQVDIWLEIVKPKLSHVVNNHVITAGRG